MPITSPTVFVVDDDISVRESLEYPIQEWTAPGLGWNSCHWQNRSAIAENTETTEKFLPEADAFVLITSYDSPLSEEEVRALHRIRHADKVLFVVVNKHDTVTVGERGQVLEFVKERLAEYSFSREPQVFTVSARQALEGKHSGNEEVLEASSIRKFEKALLAFLIEEKAEAFLASMQERILAFLAERRGIEDLPEHKELIEDLAERLRTLRAAEVNPSPLPSDRSGTAPWDMGITLDRRSACWVCGQILEAFSRFLSKRQYQLPLHTWQYENISSLYGVCASYPALAHRVASELHEIAGNLNGANWAVERISRLAASDLPPKNSARENWSSLVI